MMLHTPWAPVALAPWLSTASLALVQTHNHLSPHQTPASSSDLRPTASLESSSTLLHAHLPTAAPTAVARSTTRTARTAWIVNTNLPMSAATPTTTVEHRFQRNLSTNAPNLSNRSKIQLLPSFNLLRTLIVPPDGPQAGHPQNGNPQTQKWFPSGHTPPNPNYHKMALWDAALEKKRRPSVSVQYN